MKPKVGDIIRSTSKNKQGVENPYSPSSNEQIIDENEEGYLLRDVDIEYEYLHPKTMNESGFDKEGHFQEGERNRSHYNPEFYYTKEPIKSLRNKYRSKALGKKARDINPIDPTVANEIAKFCIEQKEHSPQRNFNQLINEELENRAVGNKNELFDDFFEDEGVEKFGKTQGSQNISNVERRIIQLLHPEDDWDKLELPKNVKKDSQGREIKSMKKKKPDIKHETVYELANSKKGDKPEVRENNLEHEPLDTFQKVAKKKYPQAKNVVELFIEDFTNTNLLKIFNTPTKIDKLFQKYLIVSHKTLSKKERK